MTSDPPPATATCPAAVAAARWWGNKLRGRMQAGFDLPPSALSGALPAGLTEERITAFEANLAAAIMDRYEFASRFGVSIDVDRGPDHILVEAATSAGIEVTPCLFTGKTTMWVQRTEFNVIVDQQELVKVSVL